jgi:hypothetical protein
VHEAVSILLVEEVLLNLPELLAQNLERVLVDTLEGRDTDGEEVRLVAGFEKKIKEKKTHRSCRSEWLTADA